MSFPHPPLRLRLIAGVAALALTASALLVGPAAAGSAAAPHRQTTGQPAAAPHRQTTGQPAAAPQAAASVTAQRAAGWLTEQFTAGTHLQTPFGGTYFDDQGLTADGILALDSAGVGQSFAATATSWLADHVDGYVGDGAAESYAGPLAKTALIAMAQGLDPRAFGGRNLIAALHDREVLPSGPDQGRFSDRSSGDDYSNAITQSLAILAERRATAVDPSANAITSLVGLQCTTGGGFQLTYPKKTPCVPDPDATAFAVQALHGLSDPDDATDIAAIVRDGLDYLVARQQADGGVVDAGGGNPPTPPVENSNSTGLAAVAFAIGGRPTNAAQAYAYLAARQQTSTASPTGLGAINFRAGGYDASTSLRSTTQAIPGLVAGAPGGSATDAGLLTVHAHGASTAPVIAAASGSYRTVSPTRFLDTRQSRPVPANSSITVAITGRAGIPAGISAAAVNITAVTPAGAGFVIAYPSGTPRPAPASNLNLVAGVTVAAAVLVKVGADGKIVLSNISNHPLDLLLDVNGYFLTGTGLAAGSYRPITPTRLLDTRTTSAVPAGGSVSVQITGGAAGVVPVDDVIAVAVTVTAVGAGSPGYVTVYPAGASRGTASTLNLITGQTIANSAIVRVGRAGKVSLINASRRPLHLLLDVAGYFVGGTGQFAGAFVPLSPTRVLDTRTGSPVAASTARPVQVGGQAGVPATGAAAIAYNLTAVAPAAAGNLRGYPTGASRPITSNINATTGRTVANLSLTGLSSSGGLSVFNDSPRPLNLLVDVAGYFRT